MIQGHEVSADDFEKEENGGIILKKRARQQFLKNLEAKMHGEMSYLSYVSERTSFRKAIWLQVGELVKAVEKGDYQLYEPIRVR
jgi:CRISPR-associated protein Cas1